jgi:uncharacterized protein (TIGR02246 family)
MRIGGLIPLLLIAACSTSKTSATDTSQAAPEPETMVSTPLGTNDTVAKAAIGKIRSGWMEKANKKDAAGVAAYYAEDASLVGTEIPLAQGKPGIEASFRQSFPASKVESIESLELVVSGNMGYDYGTFRQQVTLPNGKPQTINGYYLVTLRRESNGTWRIIRHVATTPPAKP